MGNIAYFISDPGRMPRFSDLAKFVDEKSRVASSMYDVDLTKETIQSKHEGASPSKNQNNGVKITTLATNGEGGVKYERKCICCSGTCIDSASCDKFNAMGIDERKKACPKFEIMFQLS